MGWLLLGLVSTLLTTFSTAQNYIPQDAVGLDYISEITLQDPFEDTGIDDNELLEILKGEPDWYASQPELDDLNDFINFSEDYLEEEEEEKEDEEYEEIDHLLQLIDILEEFKDIEEPINLEDPVNPEDECDDPQCEREKLTQPANLYGEIEKGRRKKRSPAPGIRRSSSSSSSSRSSSSRSSSGRSSSSRSSSSGGLFSRRRTSSSSSSRRGSGSSSSRGSSSSSSHGSSSSRGSSSGSSSSSSSSSASKPSYGWNTGSSGSTSGSTSSGRSSTGTAIAAGAGAGTVIGATSGSSSTGSRPGSGYPTQPIGGTSTGTQPSGGYPTGTRPASGYPTGTQPAGGYPTGTQPAGGYPTGTQPAGGYPTGTQPAGGYPTGTRPAGGYPTGTQPAGGYPTGTQPAGGYPTGTRPVGGYPTGTQPVGGYPTGTQPVGGYPTGTQPAGGYPTGTRPVGGYPTGTQPVGGYPTGTQPVGGYPSGTRTAGGYPTGTQPVGGYPGGSYPTNTQPVAGYPGYPSGSRPFGSVNQPYGGYPSGNQPYGGGGYPSGNQPFGGGGYSGYQPYGGGYSAGSGFPGHSYGGYSNRGYSSGGFTSGGFASGGFASGGLASGGYGSRGFSGGGYPVGGYPKPLRKKTKKEKVKAVIEKAAVAYAAHKAHKKLKKNKFLSPFGHSNRGFGGMAGGGLAAGALGLAAGKTGKKILGAYIKLQIAKYALKFGAKAAQAYFMYKLGVELDEYMVGKFVHRYHQNRVRGSSRWRHRTQYHSYETANNDTQDDITLGEYCYRACNESDKRICQFSFEIHLYQTMSRACYNCPTNTTDCQRPECLTADGNRRMVVAVNKEIPGPAIQVCAGDKVLVDVFNSLPSSAVTLHWHGLTLAPSMAVTTASATPYMDGVPGVTQCPIPPGTGFRYSFDASDPGTHFWHAQTGLERGDGVFGPLVVHQSADKNIIPNLPEHLLVVNDWFHTSTQAKYVLRQNSGQDAKPKTILINGKGRQQHDGSTAQVPYFNFIVEKNKRYRLRVINAASTNCPITISVDSHDLILLSTDGSSINPPVNTSTLLIHPGERYDGMFSAEQESGDDGATFWIRVDGGNDCQGLEQFASLQYLPTNISAVPLPTIPPDINPSSIPSTTPGMKVFSGSCSTAGQRCLSNLRSSVPLPVSVRDTKANFTFYLSFSERNIHNENIYSLLYYDIYDEDVNKRVATPQINNLSFRGTSTPLLINQRPLKSDNCSSEGVRRGHCTEDFCECLHVIKVPVGAIVDLVFIGEGFGNGTSQPVHLHGYKFWVLAQVEAESVPEVVIPESENITLPEGMSREKVMRLDNEGRLARYLESPLVKDTIAIPPGGYSVARIVAENKGFWVLESQVLFNSQAGMSLILQVGTPEDLPKAPKDFPTC